MKKTLILANNDIGLYKFRKELIQALIDEGNQIVIALPYGKLVEPLVRMGCEFVEVPIDRRGINPLKDMRLALKYRKIIKDIKPDQIITYTIKPNIYGGMMSRLLKKQYFINITGLGTAFQGNGILKKVIIMLYKLALGKVSYVFFENEGNRNVFLEYNIVAKEKAVVMNGAGVNLEEYPYTPMPTSDTIRFLFIGRVMKEKGVDELFAAARKIKEDYANVAFDIVGPFEEDYKEEVQQLQDEGIIQYHGYQEDIRPFIASCHCFVLPSYHEGMANTLLEAAAMGRPLITTDIYGCREAVEGNGILIRIQDTDSLYRGIKFYYKIPIEEQIKMGMESREIIIRKFNRKRVVEKTINKINR